MTENTYPPVKSESLKENSLFAMDQIVKGLIGEGELWEDSLAKAVSDLHDGKNRQNFEGSPIDSIGTAPKVIFITATSAVPYAISMKEAWIRAYPDEETPKFFLIDVSSQRFGKDAGFKVILTDDDIEEVEAKEALSVRHIGERFHAFENAAVFDEFFNSGTTIKNAAKLLVAAGFTNVNFLVGNWGHFKTDWGIPVRDRPIVRKGGAFLDNWPDRDDPPYKKLILNINASSKQIVRDMKIIGGHMATQILAHKPQSK